MSGSDQSPNDLPHAPRHHPAETRPPVTAMTSSTARHENGRRSRRVRSNGALRSSMRVSAMEAGAAEQIDEHPYEVGIERAPALLLEIAHRGGMRKARSIRPVRRQRVVDIGDRYDA